MKQARKWKIFCIYAIIKPTGALAHLVERFYGIEEVRSSNLLCSTIFMPKNLMIYFA